MPRRRREKYENSIYHIIVRGNNKQDIFHDDYDKNQYLKRLKRYQEKYKIVIYAYCLMTNHVHLLIYDNGQDISKFMQGLSLSYVIYFNKRYDRCGHLFQDRFKSIMVKKDSYLIELSKYIHLNSFRANIVQDAQQYKWSSCQVYLGSKDYWQLVNCEKVLSYFSDNYKERIKLYSEYLYNNKEQAEEEIAAAIEDGHESIRHMEYVKAINQDIIIKKIEDDFQIHQLVLFRRNNRQYSIERDMAIYVMALKGHLSYKELAQIFRVKAPAIGQSIKRTIERMIENNSIYNRVEKLLEQIA